MLDGDLTLLVREARLSAEGDGHWDHEGAPADGLGLEVGATGVDVLTTEVGVHSVADFLNHILRPLIFVLNFSEHGPLVSVRLLSLTVFAGKELVTITDHQFEFVQIGIQFTISNEFFLAEFETGSVCFLLRTLLALVHFQLEILGDFRAAERALHRLLEVLL